MEAATEQACPKCGTPRQGERACPKCGLAADRMASFARAQEDAVPEVVHAAWTRVVAHWDSDAEHDELLRLTTLHGCYAWVAGRYRQERARRDNDAMATRQLERIRKAAEVAMLSTAAPKPEAKTPFKSSILLLALAGLLVIVGIFYATYVKMRGPGPRDGSSAAPSPASSPAPSRRQVQPGSQVR